MRNTYLCSATDDDCIRYAGQAVIAHPMVWAFFVYTFKILAVAYT